LLLLGAVLLVAALVSALRGTLLPRLVTDVSAQEVSNYTSGLFSVGVALGILIAVMTF
jgi:cytochrome c biogenesis factor